MAVLRCAAFSVLLLTAIEAELITESVNYFDGAVQLSGFVAYPAGTGPFPVVLHVHQWAGLSDFERGRANRTAEELGYIGFAVSIYDDSETTKAASSMQARMPIVGKYNGSPELIVSRLAAAVAFIKQHSKVDVNKIAAVGYCFGGSAVLQFARLGGANVAGVPGVVSFHGGLSGLAVEGASWARGNDTKVLILNGASDNTIPKTDIDAVQASLTSANATWEFTNYAQAGHGFTHPKDGSGHFHYDKAAEERSWTSMVDFLGSTLAFKKTVPGKGSLVTQAVTYKDGAATLEGYVAYPEGATGLLPVVLHVHQWSGLSDFERQRANRTAEELGYIGFAVSVYDVDESVKAAANMFGRMGISGKYSGAPELIVSRLAAAVTFVKQHAKADASKISAVGYCFGGAAVLQFARLGAANTSGVGSVASFHGSLGEVAGKESSFCPTRVAVYNGANDPMIKDSELVALQKALQSTATYWELTNYSFAGHGFTHPTEAGNDHFHFEKTAESRSWVSMAHFLKDSFAGKGKLSEGCAKYVPALAPAKPETNASAECADDDAGVAKAAGQWGMTKCAANLCTGQYKDMMQPLCKKTCGLCNANATSSTTSAPITTNAPAAGKVKVTYTFKDLVFSKVNSTMQTEMKNAVQAGVLAALPSGYTKDHVEVTLKSGSVIAEVTVTPMKGKTAAALSSALDATAQDKMKSAVLNQVKAAPSISAALADGKELADLTVVQSAPAVVTATSTSKPPTMSTSDTVARATSMAVLGLVVSRGFW